MIINSQNGCRRFGGNGHGSVSKNSMDTWLTLSNIGSILNYLDRTIHDFLSRK